MREADLSPASETVRISLTGTVVTTMATTFGTQRSRANTTYARLSSPLKVSGTTPTNGDKRLPKNTDQDYHGDVNNGTNLDQTESSNENQPYNDKGRDQR